MEQKPLIVDSNVWIGFFRPEDTLHAQAKVFFQQWEDTPRPILTTSFVIQEVFTVLSQSVSQDKALAFYDFVANHAYINSIMLDSTMLDRIIHFIDRHKMSPKLSVVDVSLIYLALEIDVEPISFDKLLMKTYQHSLI